MGRCSDKRGDDDCGVGRGEVAEEERPKENRGGEIEAESGEEEVRSEEGERVQGEAPATGSGRERPGGDAAAADGDEDAEVRAEVDTKDDADEGGREERGAGEETSKEYV